MVSEVQDAEAVAQACRLMGERIREHAGWLALWGFVPNAPAGYEQESPSSRPDDDLGITDAVDAFGDRYRRTKPESLLLNALRVHRGRQALVDQGTFAVKEIAAALDRPVNTVRKQVERACASGALFTVMVNGERHIPAVLLDEALEARPEWKPVVAILSEAGMSGWGMWRWIAKPNAGLSGEIAAEVIRTNPVRVLAAAQRRVAQLAE